MSSKSVAVHYITIYTPATNKPSSDKCSYTQKVHWKLTLKDVSTKILIFYKQNDTVCVIWENHRGNALRPEVPMEMYQRSSLPHCPGTEDNTAQPNAHARAFSKHLCTTVKNAVLNKHTLISIQMDFLADFQMRSVDGQHIAKPNWMSSFPLFVAFFKWKHLAFFIHVSQRQLDPWVLLNI